VALLRGSAREAPGEPGTGSAASEEEYADAQQTPQPHSSRRASA
jgi:hypothetical protein